MDVAEALRRGASRLTEAGVEQPRRTVELLLADALRRERVYLIAHPEAAVRDDHAAQFERSVERRAAGEPTQYILGRQEFFGLDFAVAPGVLIPRPETELLVEQALARLHSGDLVCDMGVGSGAVAVAIAAERKDVRVIGVDIAAGSLSIAQSNAKSHGVRIAFMRCDLLTPFRNGQFDMIVSNPPYVAETARPTLQRELLHEPAEALFAGADGLDCYRRLIPEAERTLKPAGTLLLELGYGGLPGVQGLIGNDVWSTAAVFEDLAGIPRVLAVQRATS
jgi:release factor glutamine methyltransferase